MFNFICKWKKQMSQFYTYTAHTALNSCCWSKLKLISYQKLEACIMVADVTGWDKSFIYGRKKDYCFCLVCGSWLLDFMDRSFCLFLETWEEVLGWSSFLGNNSGKVRFLEALAIYKHFMTGFVPGLVSEYNLNKLPLAYC